MDNVLKEQRVEGLLRIDWEQQIERRTHYVGRGRGSATRAQRVIEHRRPTSRTSPAKMVPLPL